MDVNTCKKLLDGLDPDSAAYKFIFDQMTAEERRIDQIEKSEAKKKVDFYKYQTAKVNYENKAVPGVYVWSWGRDCDGVEAAGVSFVQARNYDEYEKELDHAYEWADGPMSWTIISKLEADQRKNDSYQIDHFAEAAGY